MSKIKTVGKNLFEGEVIEGTVKLDDSVINNTEDNFEKQKAKLAQLSRTYFELKDTSKELTLNIDSIKEEIADIVLELNVLEITVDDVDFIVKSKISRRFNKKDFSEAVDINKKEINEQTIAKLVEDSKTSSDKIGSFFESKLSETIQIKRKKE